MLLTMTEQKLLISLLKKPIQSSEQRIYKQRVSFYNAVWKLRDMGLVANSEIKIDGYKSKLWKLTVDGIIMARILSKEVKPEVNKK